MTIKDKESLSDEIIDQLDSKFFDSYHENICEVAVENFKRDGIVATILVGHQKGEATFTRLLNEELNDEAPLLMKELSEKNISTYSFVSEGKVKKYRSRTKVDCIVVSSNNRSGDSRTTIYQIVNRKDRKLKLFATGEVQDNLWNYLLTEKGRVLH
jgi:hypothetical protein